MALSGRKDREVRKRVRLIPIPSYCKNTEKVGREKLEYLPFKFTITGSKKEISELDKRIHGDGRLYHFRVKTGFGMAHEFYEKNYCMAILDMHCRLNKNEDIKSVELMEG